MLTVSSLKETVVTRILNQYCRGCSCGSVLHQTHSRSPGMCNWKLTKNAFHMFCCCCCCYPARCTVIRRLQRIYLHFWRVADFVLWHSPGLGVLLCQCAVTQPRPWCSSVSVCCDTAQALVFLLVSVCCDTAHTKAENPYVYQHWPEAAALIPRTMAAHLRQKPNVRRNDIVHLTVSISTMSELKLMFLC